MTAYCPKADGMALKPKGCNVVTVRLRFESINSENQVIANGFLVG